jgi:fructose-1-phosphate kinase PfkB-like protein
MRELQGAQCAARAQLIACRKMHDEEVKQLRYELGQADSVIAAFVYDYEQEKRLNDMLTRQLAEERAKVAALTRLAREAELVSEKVRVFCG